MKGEGGAAALTGGDADHGADRGIAQAVTGQLGQQQAAFPLGVDVVIQVLQRTAAATAIMRAGGQAAPRSFSGDLDQGGGQTVAAPALDAGDDAVAGHGERDEHQIVAQLGDTVAARADFGDLHLDVARRRALARLAATGGGRGTLAQAHGLATRPRSAMKAVMMSPLAWVRAAASASGPAALGTST